MDSIAVGIHRRTFVHPRLCFRFHVRLTKTQHSYRNHLLTLCCLLVLVLDCRSRDPALGWKSSERGIKFLLSDLPGPLGCIPGSYVNGERAKVFWVLPTAYFSDGHLKSLVFVTVRHAVAIGSDAECFCWNAASLTGPRKNLAHTAPPGVHKGMPIEHFPSQAKRSLYES